MAGGTKSLQLKLEVDPQKPTKACSRWAKDVPVVHVLNVKVGPIERRKNLRFEVNVRPARQTKGPPSADGTGEEIARA